MGKNDFDMDFDFEEEYGFDPKAFLGTEDYDEDIDLSEFSDEDLGLTPQKRKEAEENTAAAQDAFDAEEDLDPDDFLNMGAKETFEEETAGEEEEEYELAPEPEFFEEEELTEEPDYEEEEEFAVTEDSEEDEYEEDEQVQYDWEDDSDVSEDPDPEETEMTRNNEYEEELTEEEVFEDETVYEEESEEEDTPRQRARRAPKERKEFKLPKITLPKLPKPNIFTKFYDLYFAPVLDKSKQEEPVDPNNPRRRRRKSKAQLFKEVYLPPILVCVCLILVLSFTIGSISNAITLHKIEKDAEASRLDESKSAEAQAEQQQAEVLAQAEDLAAGYNYEDAITLLDSFGDLTKYPELNSKRTEFVTAQSQLVEYTTPTLIPNLSFHVLIEDMARAKADEELGGKYNKNFVTTKEFRGILNNLYTNGYVLVDYDSFTEVKQDATGVDQILPDTIKLPADKKPIMITETMVNYFNYMIDGDNDNIADAKGDGFASRLVVQGGKIKAEYINASGETLIGDYDLVPILESFIEEHPDFSYQGARATLAVTGKEGIFGYRINSSYTASVSQEYRDQQVAGATEVVKALRDKGYTLACFTYGNIAYGQKSAAQITDDLTQWSQQISPVLGETNILVFAQASNISDYSGNLFNVLYKEGFRYFVSNGSEPWGEVNNSYVRQNRLMVTGETMAHYSDRFTGMFDCAAILDVNIRGEIAKG